MLTRSTAPTPALPEPCGGLLLATPIQHDHARLIARARIAGHDHCRKPSEVIGTRAEMLRTEAYGALAEIVLLDGLFRQGFTPQGYTLIADSVPAGPDFTLQGKRYQIKAVLPNSHYLCINEQARLDPRQSCDYYIAVVFLSATRMRVLRPIPALTVSRWELRQGHSPYRSISIRNLSALTSSLSERKIRHIFIPANHEFFLPLSGWASLPTLQSAECLSNGSQDWLLTRSLWHKSAFSLPARRANGAGCTPDTPDTIRP